jgi:signal transduction histidine kinase/HAMP domain-containing protein/response regulator RpfG family c-di-GMP phosphodiesterase
MPTVEGPVVSGTEMTALLTALTALKKGRPGVRLPLEWTGVAGKVADAFNDVVELNERMAQELARLRRVVGTEGRLNQRLSLGDVGGFWQELVDSVNDLIDDLVHPTSETARVIGAVAQGNLAQTVALEIGGRRLQGEFLRTATTINRMVDQLSSFASEVTRVAREVGTEGKLGGQAQVKGVAGTWKDLTDSVNSMASNLTSQVRNIADVTTAVANGDLSKKITVDVKGEFLELKGTINTMVDQLRSFASEVTRVAREVGTEGNLGGQARVEGVSGTWKDLTDSVNSMAGNLTAQVRNIAAVTTAVANGDLSRKITVDVKGEILELKNTINTMVGQLSSFASEVTRVAREVGTEGKLGGQADVPGVAGTWKNLTDSVNSMAENLTAQVRNIAAVTTAVAYGDLSRKITVDVKGEILELKNTINTMVDQLRSFAAEVTRVAREVGSEGKLGGQAQVPGVAGTWKDLTDSVNSMAGNLTAQVRGIAKVVTSVANGDLKRKLTVDAKGEIAELAETINEMIDTLATFAEQVTTVAHEVGVEGQLGGQAKVPGAAGTWKALTENVNQLAANLTTQVRAIAKVATAVTKGDLTRSITVGAQGEVAALKDTINEMIRNLRDTIQENTEQDWLKTNLTKFSRMLQGQRDLTNVGRMVLSELCPVVSAQYAEFYVLDSNNQHSQLRLLANYAADGEEALGKGITLGQGLVGQCALDKRVVLLNNMPEGYIRISSGLGCGVPRSILVLPLIFEGQVKGVLELASFEGFNPTHQAFLEQLTESISIVLNTIEANMRTENLLKQSESLAQQLQTRQEELQKTNEELQEKAGLLAYQKKEVERKNHEVEQARQALEEKAEQLALTSKYKSEFLANMSHELRTPLNSLLILSDQLSKNAEGNLTSKQTEFAKTIYSSGNELLMLINDILDLSKIESGTVVVDSGEVRLDSLRSYVERTFRPVAESKNLDFLLRFDPQLPQSISTDNKRLQQIIKNLLSNAFKFTHRGQVTFTAEPAQSGWDRENEDLNRAAQVLRFSVSDTGIGISPDKQKIIFEAFQQADGSTSRKHGGTGLGLAISRELSRLLGGEICLRSTPGRGSTFALYLPSVYTTSRIPYKQPGSVGAPAASTATMAAALATTLTKAHPESNGSGSAAPPAPQSALEPAPDVEGLVNEGGDDRDSIQPGDRVLLIVENDPGFVRVLLDVARDKGFKGLVTSMGATALALTREHSPCAITLDIHLADTGGWRVLERLKNDIATRHIPVYVISTDDARDQALAAGALAFIPKPLPGAAVLDVLLTHVNEFLGRVKKSLLVIEPDADARRRILPLLDAEGVQIVPVEGAQDALRLLKEQYIDCMILRAKSIDVAEELLSAGIPIGPRLTRLPVLVFDEDQSDEHSVWKRLGDECTLCHVYSPERLLDRATLFLHRPMDSLLEDKRRLLIDLYESDKVLAGKRVLIVDDDIRNIFALSTVLEEHAMAVLSADNGHDAIRILQHEPAVDIVLMDIMMPEMDGLEAMREIRKLPQLRHLPIIAVTAKAMKGDREKCIAAGAWDYLSKPVDTEQMLAVLRARLQR